MLYAPDDEQGFPCAAGEDGILFTEDDVIATLPAGYTIAHIDGEEVTFDRSQIASVEVLENPVTATPDFSDQGIVESYETVIDFMRECYVFNNFYDFNWDALYAEYLPQVERAEAEDNLGLYYLALSELARSIGDGHVYIARGQSLSTPEVLAVFNDALGYINGGLGATATSLDDGRVIIGSIEPNGPAAGAGLTFGTEIVSVNGVPIEEAIVATPYSSFPGSPDSTQFVKDQFLLKAAPNTEAMTTVLTAVPNVAAGAHPGLMPMEYKLVDSFGYVRWTSFNRTGISIHIYADFIKQMNQMHIPGIIIDLRSNGGGSALMEFAALSYLYGEDDPYTLEGTTQYKYDTASSEWITEFNEAIYSAPAGAAPYEGEVVYLVDASCGSACEFMAYALQRTGRATIIGQYASLGAGGNTNGVILPGGIQFNYTAGTELNDETGMPTFQFVGVQPDIDVPITEETERMKFEGGDPVLDIAVAYLQDQALAALNFEEGPIGGGAFTTMVPTTWTPDPTNAQYSSADGSSILTISEYTLTDDTDPDLMAAAINDHAEYVDEYEAESGTWSLYNMPFGTQLATLAVTTIDDVRYAGLLVANDEVLRDLLTEHVLEPALDGFTVVGE